MDQKKLKRKIAFGVILIMIGLSFMLNDFIVARREKVFSAMNLELTELMNHQDSTPVVTTEEETSIDSEPQASDYETYVGILEIPKIGFSKGFYQKESSLNNVKFNIKILSQSNYPDEENGNVIIIGHSGNYSNSYFGNLYQLVVGDMATIQYHDKNYVYKIVNIYKETKDGTITIYRDETKNCLTLITCTKDDDTTQTVYIFERVSVE